MQRWEYWTMKVTVGGWFLGGNLDVSAFNHELSRAGEQGWELVAAFDTNKGYGSSREAVAVFKRPRA